MNDILQQLVSMGPGLGAAISGDGNAFAAFMDGYQKTLQQLEQQKRLKQQDSLALEDRQLALEDRQRAMTRQDEADAATRQARTQQQALQGLQIPGHLAEMGAAADDPQGAQAIIEAAMPNLMKAFGQESMAYGQPAVEMAQRTITGRQKKQVEEFLDKWEKSDHAGSVSKAQVTPAEIYIQLPEHLRKYLGKPGASLAELQSFASLPIGKPAALKSAPFTLSPGATRYDGDGSPIATAPERPPKPTGDGKPKKQEWVIRNGEIAPIQPGTAQPGDRPYNETTQRKNDENEKRNESVAGAAQEALTLVQNLKSMPGMSGAVGAKGPASLFGMLDRPISGTKAAGYRSYVDSLKSKLTIPAMQQMRGLGAMSDREFRTMSDSVTALSTEMPESMFLAELGKIEQTLQTVVQRLQVQQSAPAMNAPGGGVNIAPIREPIPGIRGGVAVSHDGGLTWKRES